MSYQAVFVPEKLASQTKRLLTGLMVNEYKLETP
jgi:hypothetical protein